MPRSAPSACTHPGCPELVQDGSRCAKHKQERKRDYRSSAERKQLETFYSSTIWRSISKAFRKRYPLCVQCAATGRTTVADVVDHIIEIRDDWSKRHDPKNLQSLCHACHNSKTRSVQQARAAMRKR